MKDPFGVSVQWTTLVSFVMPLLIQFIQRCAWSTRVKSIVAVVASAVGGLVTAIITGQILGAPLGWEAYITDAAIAVVGASQFYDKWWQPLGLASPRLGSGSPIMSNGTSPTAPDTASSAQIPAGNKAGQLAQGEQCVATEGKIYTLLALP